MKYDVIFVGRVQGGSENQYLAKQTQITVPPAQIVQNLPLYIDDVAGKCVVQTYGYHVDEDILIVRVGPSFNVTREKDLLLEGWDPLDDKYGQAVRHLM